MRIRMQAPVVDCMIMGNVQACTECTSIQDPWLWLRICCSLALTCVVCTVSVRRTTQWCYQRSILGPSEPLRPAERWLLADDVSSQCRRCSISIAAMYRGSRRRTMGPHQSNRGVPTVAYFTHVFGCRLGAVSLVWATTKGPIETLQGSSMPANVREGRSVPKNDDAT
jgi:hypothetical protein